MDMFFRRHQLWFLFGSLAFSAVSVFLDFLDVFFVLAYFWLGVVAEGLWGWNQCRRLIMREIKAAEKSGDSKRIAEAYELLIRLGAP